MNRPLHVAAFMGCMNIVVYLIQRGANPDTPTVRGETPLHLAARANQVDIIRVLLRNGAKVDARARVSFVYFPFIYNFSLLYLLRLFVYVPYCVYTHSRYLYMFRSILLCIKIDGFN